MGNKTQKTFNMIAIFYCFLNEPKTLLIVHVPTSANHYWCRKN